MAFDPATRPLQQLEPAGPPPAVRRRRKALSIVGTAVALDILFGTAYALLEHIPWPLGLYWALQTATTVGYGDLPPRTVGGHLVAVLVMVTEIPLFAAAFAQLHLDRIDARLARHHRAIRDEVRKGCL